MTKRQYYKSTPKDIRYLIEARNERFDEEVEKLKTHAWLSGMYVLHAIGCAFNGGKYPEAPIGHGNSTKEIAQRTGKTEEELNGELVMATLQIMQANANIAKNAEE